MQSSLVLPFQNSGSNVSQQAGNNILPLLLSPTSGYPLNRHIQILECNRQVERLMFEINYSIYDVINEHVPAKSVPKSAEVF